MDNRENEKKLSKEEMEKVNGGIDIWGDNNGGEGSWHQGGDHAIPGRMGCEAFCIKCQKKTEFKSVFYAHEAHFEMFQCSECGALRKL